MHQTNWTNEKSNFSESETQLFLGLMSLRIIGSIIDQKIFYFAQTFFPLTKSGSAARKIIIFDQIWGDLLNYKAGLIVMKNWLWTISAIAIAVIFSGCSKSKGPSPEDTALIRGTDREIMLEPCKVMRLQAKTNSLRRSDDRRIGWIRRSEAQDSTWSDPSALATRHYLSLFWI